MVDGLVRPQISSEINALVIRQMKPDLAKKIFDDWYALVCSGHGAPNGSNLGRTCWRDGDGWRLNYQGGFASGCQNATWNYLQGPMVIDEATGQTADASFMIPKGEFEIVDTWDTSGRRGSGSHDVRMVDRYVPPGHLLPGRHRQLHRPRHGQGAVGIEHHAEGPARGAVPHRRGAGQADGGARLCDGHPGPARGPSGPAAVQGRLVPEWEHFWPALLACAHAAQTCREVVSMINNTAATTGCRMDSPLERQLRDAQQAANHMLISYRHYEQLGKTFVGHPPADMYKALIEPV